MTPLNPDDDQSKLILLCSQYHEILIRVSGYSAKNRRFAVNINFINDRFRGDGVAERVKIRSHFLICTLKFF